MEPIPSYPVPSNYTNPVKPDALAADPDIILVQQSAIPVELQSDLILQDIGGTELIQILRHDMVGGRFVVYSPIKNLSDVEIEFNPNTITGFVPTLRGMKENYEIQLDEMLGTLQPTSNGPIYMDGADIVVELEGLSESNIIELAVSTPRGKITLSKYASDEVKYLVDGGGPESNQTGHIDGGSPVGYNVDMIDGGGP